MAALESFEQWNQSLVESNARVLVEGKNDAAKLIKLGIEGKRIYTVSGKSVYKIVEELEDTHDVIILTDLDAEGKFLYNKLRHHLQKHGKRIDNRFRNFLFKQTSVTNIEGLSLE